MNKPHIVEIGCAGVSSLHHLITPNSKVQIIEPHPNHVAATRFVYKNMPNVEIHGVAIWKEMGTIRLYDNGLSSFVDGIHSPAVVNDGFDPEGKSGFIVDARTFDEFDDGTIDMIEIDMEGGEWYAMEKMASRPYFITIEMEYNSYRNPHFDDISEWMITNGYDLFQKHDANHTYKKQS